MASMNELSEQLVMSRQLNVVTTILAFFKVFRAQRFIVEPPPGKKLQHTRFEVNPQIEVVNPFRCCLDESNNTHPMTRTGS